MENNKWYGNLSINKKKEIINKKRNYSYKNIEKRKKQQKEYRSRPEVKIQKKEYYEKNKKDNRIKKSCYIRERRRNNLCFRLYSNFSCMIYRSIKQNKNFESITKYLPYTSEQLKEHIESKWEPWMNWDNYGKFDSNKKTWQIDHIIPQSLLLYNSMEHPNFLKCWSLENLQPLETMKNLQKSNN